MHRHSIGKILFAILLIGIGVAVLLSNFGVIEVDVGDLFGTYWPVILIWIGLSTMITAFKYRNGRWDASTASLITGLIILLLGWNFLADNLGWYTISFSFIWSVFWPILLIYIGLRLLLRKKKSFIRFDVEFDDEKKKEQPLEETLFSEEVVSEEKDSKPKRIYKGSLIGDINMGKELYDLKNLHLWNGIGDVDLDLSRAILPDGEAKVLINGWIGDVDVIVPKDLPVWIEVRIRIGEIRLFGKSDGGITKEQEFKSVGYDEATKKVHMIIDLKIGDIRVVEK